MKLVQCWTGSISGTHLPNTLSIMYNHPCKHTHTISHTRVDTHTHKHILSFWPLWASIAFLHSCPIPWWRSSGFLVKHFMEALRTREPAPSFLGTLSPFYLPGFFILSPKTECLSSSKALPQHTCCGQSTGSRVRKTWGDTSA